MKKNKAYRMISLVLVTLMVFSMIPYLGSSVYAETLISNGDYSISADGEYELSDGYSGTITIESGVSTVTIIGDTDNVTNTGTSIVVAAGRTEALKLTIKDLNITAPADNHGIDFGSAGAGEHKLYISGICKITGGDIVTSGGYHKSGAGIHVPSGVSLTIDKVSGLTDDGAQLKATGGYLGAGIGGGDKGSGGDITISGGTVTATSEGSGAGIGGGDSGSGGTITIIGGIVTATSESSGAGIGGGYSGSGGTIEISGGTVTAICKGTNHAGAGIGGGRHRHGGDITISGGTVTATGGAYGAGIGGGSGGWGGNIRIENNPTVIATKGEYAPVDVGNGIVATAPTILKDSSGNDMNYIRTEIKDFHTNQGISNATVTIDDSVGYKTNSDGITGYFVKGNINDTYNYQVSANGYPTSSGVDSIVGQSIRKTYTLDNTPPKLNTAAVNAKTLVLTYNEALDDTSKPEATDFEVIANGSAKLNVELVAIANDTVTLTLEDTIKDTDIVTISYATGTNPIQDKVKNASDSFEDVFVTNNTSDTIAPILTTATVNKARLELEYNEALDTASIPAIADFTVETSEGSNISVLAVDIKDNSVILILENAVKDTDTITITYTKGINPIQDVKQRQASAFTNEPVTNNINPQLSKLETSTGLWDKNFSPNELNYTINVDNEVEQIDITATTSQHNAYMIINGKTYGGGEQTSRIDLDKGTNIIPITVKTYDGSMATKYELTIIRGLSSNADLHDLQLSSGTIDGGFKKDKEIYTITPDQGATTISITAITDDTDATLTINGNPATSGTKVDIDISSGGKLIPIIVTAYDGETQRTYILSVNGTSSDASIQSLSINPGGLNFKPGENTYSISINNAVTTIDLTAAPSDSNAMMILKDKILESGVSKAIDLGVGENTIEIMVVAQDSSTNTYTININRREGLTIENTSLPVAVVGMNYSAVLSADGETSPYEWSASNLPDGLSLNETSGEISGVPNKAGSYDVDVTVTDSTTPSNISTTTTITLKITLCGNGGYLIKPDNDASYTAGMTSDGIPTMTVNQGISGFKYFSVNVTPVSGHAGKEVAIFVHLRNDVQVGIMANKVDFDTFDNTQAGFNVKAGDVIKVYIVDDLTNDENFNPNVL